MTIYWLGTGLEAVASSVGWSETTERRKPLKGAVRWYVTDADRAPLGQLPDEIRAEIDAHWALSFAKNANLPDTFMTVGSAHFTGAPFARGKVCDVFEFYSEGNFERIPIKKFWSIHDQEAVPEQYFVANFYNSADVVDPALSPLRKVVNPKVGQPFSLFTSNPKAVFVNANNFNGRHLLRDNQTSVWFCDDVFREEIERVTPRTYRFSKVCEV